MLTILLLILSNIFMTFAWYGHLKFRSSPLWVAILASWGIAFFEYCLMVPANRHGYARHFTAAQLKIMQEVITLIVFAVFAVLYLKETLRWNHFAAFLLILGAVVLVSLKTGDARAPQHHAPEPPPRQPAPTPASTGLS